MSIEQKKKILLMYISMIDDKTLASSLKRIVLSATVSNDFLNYIIEIVSMQLKIESGKSVSEKEIKDIVVLGNVKSNFLSSILEAFILFQMLDALKQSKSKPKNKPKPF